MMGHANAGQGSALKELVFNLWPRSPSMAGCVLGTATTPVQRAIKKMCTVVGNTYRKAGPSRDLVISWELGAFYINFSIINWWHINSARFTLLRLLNSMLLLNCIVLPHQYYCCTELQLAARRTYGNADCSTYLHLRRPAARAERITW